MAFNIKVQPKEEDDNMFNMAKIGANIAKFRKEKGLTQMGLANELGISFQAVSNWERGLSCPDISKLGELSELLGVSIDEILDNRNGISIVRERTKRAFDDDHGEHPDGDEDELAEHEDDELEDLEDLDDELEDLEDDLDGEGVTTTHVKLPNGEVITLRTKETLDPEDIASMAPILNEKTIERMLDGSVEAKEKKGEKISFEELMSLAPFLSEGYVEKLADRILTDGADSYMLSGLAPFLSSKKLNELARPFAERGDIAGMMHLAPFLEEDVVTEIAVKAMKDGGLKAALPLLPFVDSALLEKYIDENM